MSVGSSDRISAISSRVTFSMKTMMSFAIGVLLKNAGDTVWVILQVVVLVHGLNKGSRGAVCPDGARLILTPWGFELNGVVVHRVRSS